LQSAGAVGSAARGASAPTEGGEGRGHIVAAPAQLVTAAAAAMTTTTSRRRRRRRRFWHTTQDCVAPYVDHILHRDFWAISVASGSVRLWDLKSCCMVLSRVM